MFLKTSLLYLLNGRAPAIVKEEILDPDIAYLLRYYEYAGTVFNLKISVLCRASAFIPIRRMRLSRPICQICRIHRTF